MGFRKAKPLQSALKLAIYGAAGSGKTFTSLLCAESLAKVTGKRVAFVDTERGTDFYAKEIKARRIHPEPFDFDAIYTRSITEVLKEVHAIDPGIYSVVVIDSITHIWEACINSYTGRKTKIGSIPMQAWGPIKKPYKQLMQWIMSTPLHVFICGRQGNDWQEDEEKGELVNIGYKMKAEGETPYEPHILLRMEVVRKKKGGDATITAFAEKDRTGILAGRVIPWPTPQTIVEPLLAVLGETQASVSTEEATDKDAEVLEHEREERQRFSSEQRRVLEAELQLASSEEEVEAVAKKVTANLKRQMVSEDVAAIRQAYQEASARVTRRSSAVTVGDEPPPGEGYYPQEGDDSPT